MAPLAFALAGLASIAGCKDDACRQMLACCEVAADVDGVGSACGELASDVRDPSTCKTILKTVRFVYDDKGIDQPAICRPDGKEAP